MAVATEDKVYEVDGLGAAKVERKGRSVKFDFKIGETEEHGEARDVLAVVTVSHSKAGINYFNGERTTTDYFNVSLSNAKVGTSTVGFSVRSFTMFAGLGLTRFDAGNRFSAKKLREAADAGFEFFKALYEDGDARVLAYFDAANAD